MKLGFILFKYFPFGGLQRDMLRIAQVCQEKGHEVHIFTLSWEGPRPADIEVHILSIERISSHARNQAFYEALQPLFRKLQLDRLIGFNKMPGLDFYYAADPCLKEKLLDERSWLVRQLPRYRHFLDFEDAVFNVQVKTEILMIAPRQEKIYQRYYHTQGERLHMLPPGILMDRMAPANAAEVRADFRKEFGLAENDRLILCIGSGFRTKGLDRSLRAFADLPDELAGRTRLIAIGSDNGESFKRLAKSLGVSDRFEILGGRDDVPRFLQGGDLLLHPAYYENSGMVILEAVIAGLPVLTTSNVGYAFYVKEAKAGLVVDSPFDQGVLNEHLVTMLESPQRAEWSANGVKFGKTSNLYSMPEVASCLILDEGTCNDSA